MKQIVEHAWEDGSITRYFVSSDGETVKIEGGCYEPMGKSALVSELISLPIDFAQRLGVALVNTR